MAEAVTAMMVGTGHGSLALTRGRAWLNFMRTAAQPHYADARAALAFNWPTARAEKTNLRGKAVFSSCRAAALR